MNKKFLVFSILATSPALARAEEAAASFISLVVDNAGSAGWATFAISVVGFTLVFKTLLDLKVEKIMPSGLMDDVQAALEEEDYEEAYAIVQDNHSFLGRVLEGGLSKMNYGYDAVNKGAEDAWVNEQTALMQTASYVQLTGQIAPMLGLFGTVSGMMDAFAVLAVSSGAANPKDLAIGIMNALVTTFIGLLVAIPCNMVYLYIRNRIVKAGLDVITASSEVLTPLRGEQE
jgi:biopolymer transport protein ExbB